MAATREKTAKPLGFDITAPSDMGLSRGKTWLGESADTSLWLAFSVCPSKSPSQQRIYLAPKEEGGDDTTPIRNDLKKWRRLTPEIKGSLRFSMRPLTDQQIGDATRPPIGQLCHGPEFSHPDYGHAEFYSIEINLPENEFSQIRDAVLTGRPPTAITIWTPDVEYGGAPDGSDKVWEVLDAHSTFATIVGFSLALSTDIPRVGVGQKKTENEEENELAETGKLKEAILHSREDIQLLCYGQATLNSSLAGLRKQISILIVVAIVIGIVTALHL